MNESRVNNSNKKMRLILVALLLGGIVLGGVYWRRNKQSQVEYEELQAQRGDLHLSILSTGTVQPENRLEIKPPIPGRVEEVLVSEGQQVQKGEVLAWMSSTERAALLDAARSKGERELKRWEEFYRPTPVISPITGTIILRNVGPGQTFTSSDPIFAVSNRLTVKAQVDETDMAQIKLGLPAEIVLDAYPEKKISGRVDHIAFEAKTVNNVTTYVVDVLPDQVPEFMRSGMTANITFSVGAKQGILLLANEGIKYQGSKIVVLVPQQNGPPREKEIQTGMTNGKFTEIISGLREGDKVLVARLPSLTRSENKGGGPFSSMRGNRGRGKGGRGGH